MSKKMSEQRSQQAGEALQEALQERWIETFGHVVEQAGATLVSEKDVAEAQGRGGIVDEDVALEVVLEGSEVDVRRAASAE